MWWTKNKNSPFEWIVKIFHSYVIWRYFIVWFFFLPLQTNNQSQNIMNKTSSDVASYPKRKAISDTPLQNLKIFKFHAILKCVTFLSGSSGNESQLHAAVLARRKTVHSGWGTQDCPQPVQETVKALLQIRPLQPLYFFSISFATHQPNILHSTLCTVDRVVIRCKTQTIKSICLLSSPELFIQFTLCIPVDRDQRLVLAPRVIIDADR